MTQLSASELASELGVSRGRVSQYVAEGKLEGCYAGSGRSRRFDLEKTARALGKRLDAGQLMGNGAGTRRALRELEPAASQTARDLPLRPAEGAELPPGDADRYELARTQKAEEEARRLRRMNAEAEGRYVLTSEVELQVGRLIGQEVSEFETVLREGARRIADRLGVDFLEARSELVAAWRDHRAGRSTDLQAQAEAAVKSAAETEQDI